MTALVSGACTEQVLNSPYPAMDDFANTLYTSFPERPKHLDPALSYSSNEYALIGNIYEPPFQYHYLKRPHELVPLTATQIPSPKFLDSQRRPLRTGYAAADIAFSVYEVTITPGIQYQPHPAFARKEDGTFVYHDLDGQAAYREIADFETTASRELTAEDYVYQIKRLAHPGVHSPIFGFMARFILGLDELAETLAIQEDDPFIDLRQHHLPGVEVVDRYTYRILIRGYYPQFIYWLAMPFFSPMPWEADRFYSQAVLRDRNMTLDWFPVGTGPYFLSHNDPNRRMVMDRNPNFRGETYPAEGEPADAAAGFLADAGQKMPFIDRVVFSLEKESIPIWSKFLQGYYDSSGVLPDSFDQAITISAAGESQLTEEMRRKGIRLATSVAPSTLYFGFNMLDPLVGGSGEAARKLRQAIAIAIDQQEAITIFRNGLGVAMQSPIPPGIFGYAEGRDGINPYIYDWVAGKPQPKPIAVARRLLSEAGYPDGRHRQTGKPLSLYFDTAATGPEAKAYLDWLRKQFAKLDIELVVRATDYNRFQDKVRKGTFQLLQWGWNADYPDPENFLFLFYGPNGKALHGGENTSNFQNDQYDRFFERMKILPNGPERARLIGDMVEIVRRESPWASGLHPVQYTLYHAWNANLKPDQMAYNTLKYRRIDARRRADLRQEWNTPVWWPVVILAGLLATSLLPAMRLHHKRNRATGRGLE